MTVTPRLKLDNQSVEQEIKNLQGEVAQTATVALAAGASNTMTITITLKDGFGTAFGQRHRVEVYMSGSSTGAGLTSSSYSGALTATTGDILTALTAKKHVIANTNTSGVLVLSLVDSGKPATEYVCVVLPNGRLIVSAASGTSWGA